ncbi:hypothetical protein [Caldibacillus thermoamylovorans]|uniref:hypothetical protein n=1 Tax=Caldibacillus thermoamylovorans TaxID=35841 RepID=UPI00190F852C|nr:hypothetical protein [Caldibacillus thermoamylovorans]
MCNHGATITKDIYCMNADDVRWWSDNQKQHLVANADDCDGDFFGLRDNQLRRLVYECR